MDTRAALLDMPTDIQEMVWRKYHKGCLDDMVEHRQRLLQSKLVKEIHCYSRMCVLDDDEPGEPMLFTDWFFEEFMTWRDTDINTFVKWIGLQSPPFDEWYIGSDDCDGDDE